MPAGESLRAYSPLVVLGGLTIFAPLIDGGTTHYPVLIIRLALLAALAAWLIAAMKADKLSVSQSRLFLILAVFVAWTALSVVRSPYLAASLQGFISLLTYAAMLLLAVHLVESPRQVWGLALVILVMGLFEAGVGIYQYVWLSRPRATGTFFNPNFFAAYETAVFAVAFGILCFRKSGDVRWGIILWLTAGMTAAAFVLARSRGAALGLLAGVIVIGLYRYGRIFLGVLLLSLVVGFLVPNPLQQRVLTIGAQDPYAFTRLDIWKNSLQRAVDHPSGAGLGLYQYLSFRYRFPLEQDIARYGKRAESAHNEYLQMAVELGWPGLALFLTAIGVVGMEIRKTVNGLSDPWERGLAIGLAGGIAGVLVHAGVDSVFHEPALVLLALLFAGMILAMTRLRGISDRLVSVSFPYRPANMLLVALLVVMGTILAVRPAAAWYAFEGGKKEAAGGSMERTLDWYRWAARIDPGVSAYHEAVAAMEEGLYRQSGDVTRLLRAEEELRLGTVLNPLDSRLPSRLGVLMVLSALRSPPGLQRDLLLEQAAASYEQAIRLDPYSPVNYLELGKVRWAQGRVDEAQRVFRQAAKYEPNFLPVRIQLTELLLKLGDKAAARLEYAEIVRIEERYRTRPLTALERQYLDVDLASLSLALGGGSRP